MQFLAQGAEQLNQTPFNGEVHIFSLQTGIELAPGCLSSDILQALDQLGRLALADHSATAQHAGMGDGAVQVLLQQGDVKTDRGVEALDRRMQALLEALAPGRRGGINSHSGLGAQR